MLIQGKHNLESMTPMQNLLPRIITTCAFLILASFISLEETERAWRDGWEFVILWFKRYCVKLTCFIRLNRRTEQKMQSPSSR